MRQHSCRPAPALVLASILAACGQGALQPSQEPETQSLRSTDNTTQTRRPQNRSEDATDADPSPSVDPELDCSGIMLHEGHETCDADDVAAADASPLPPRDGDANTDETAAEKPLPSASKPQATPPPSPGSPNVVTFRIKAGTGTGPWNTEAQIVQVKVGQTLRIVNDDSTPHRLHTNGAPCAHGQNFGPGASFDCKITRAFDSGTSPGGLYDHVAGPTARFYVKAVP